MIVMLRTRNKKNPITWVNTVIRQEVRPMSHMSKIAEDQDIKISNSIIHSACN
jgi:hypothetical protein